MILCAVLAVAYRPSILPSSKAGAIDLWSLAAITAMLVQMIPLPRGVLRAIDPAGDAFARAVLLADAGGPLPISIDLARTVAAVGLFVAAVALFVLARAILDRGGARTVARIVGIIGLVLAAVAIVQSATGHGLVYGRWKPADEGAEPFGPFVNRNHFATWAVMAIPLLAGYLTAHASVRHGSRSPDGWRRNLVSAFDGRAWLLLSSTTMLIVALAASLSRSGLLGLAAALVCGALLAAGGPRTDHPVGGAPRTGRAGALIAVVAAVALLAVAIQVGPGTIAHRLATTRTAVADRLTIWHDTLPVLRDFWLTGTGVGTYLTSMAVYQRSSPGVIFNQAHNHYVQVAAEGGILVGVPVLFALASLARAVLASLRADRSPMYWIRVGGAAGLCGVAVQSVWETGLTIPANAAFAAVLAALAVHEHVNGGERV